MGMMKGWAMMNDCGGNAAAEGGGIMVRQKIEGDWRFGQKRETARKTLTEPSSAGRFSKFCGFSIRARTDISQRNTGLSASGAAHTVFFGFLRFHRDATRHEPLVSLFPHEPSE